MSYHIKKKKIVKQNVRLGLIKLGRIVKDFYLRTEIFWRGSVADIHKCRSLQLLHGRDHINHK
jgi:hypothetical protein